MDTQTVSYTVLVLEKIEGGKTTVLEKIEAEGVFRGVGADSADSEGGTLTPFIGFGCNKNQVQCGKEIEGHGVEETAPAKAEEAVLHENAGATFSREFDQYCKVYDSGQSVDVGGPHNKTIVGRGKMGMVMLKDVVLKKGSGTHEFVFQFKVITLLSGHGPRYVCY
jgi:hypothetical protein